MKLTRKLPIAALAAGLALAGLAAAPAQAADVVFADSDLATCVNQKLGQPASAPVTDAQAASITTLECYSSGISNAGGIESLSNLQSLTLFGTSITDTAPIASLSRLTYLNLAGNSGANITPLGALTGLRYLNLSGDGVTDLSPIAPLVNLTDLYLTGNQISDLGPVSGMTGLVRLDAASNRISDLAPLANLQQLDTLFLHVNRISSVSPLSGLTGLKRILLDSNRISDASPLAGIAAGLVPAPNEYLQVANQRIVLPSIAVGATQQTPLVDYAGAALAVSTVSAGSQVASDGLSWRFLTANTGNKLNWKVLANAGYAGTVTFSGTITQDSTEAPARPTTLVNDQATTPYGTPVSISVLANDGLAGEPALDASTLTLIDANGAAASSVTTPAGTFTVSGSTVVFAPADGFSGAAGPVRYRATNAEGAAGTAEIRVTVQKRDGGSGSDANANSSSSASANSGAGSSSSADANSGANGSSASNSGASANSASGSGSQANATARANASGTAGSAASGNGSADLAVTGGQVPWLPVAAGALLLLAGGITLVLRLRAVRV